jgi:beta-N-acetylhexosaminidase
MKLSSEEKAILAHFSPGFGGTQIPEWLYPWLENGLGGVTLFSSNCPSLDVTSKLIEELKNISPNLIVSIDEEGGDVTRLFVPEGSPFPTPALLGRCNDVALTENSFFELGKVLRSVGVDLNLAPVADVSVEIESPIVGVRSFSSNFDVAANHVVGAVQGLRRAGIASCAKHFPGHGGVVEDSHHDLPSLKGSLEELENTHIKPFKAAIEDGIEAVMTGHIVVPALDGELPTSISPKVTQGYLRNTLKFKGLIVTDALDMGALGGPKKIHQSAYRAFLAGADILCFSGLFDQSQFVENSLQRIKEGLNHNEFDLEKLLFNAKRIWDWKAPAPHGSSANNMPDRENYLKGVYSQGELNLTQETVHLIELSADPTIAAGFVGWGLRRALTFAGKKVKLESSDVDLAAITERNLVVAFRDAFRDVKIQNTLERIKKARPDTIFVDMGWPTLSFTPKNVIRTYGSSALASELVVEIMTSSSTATV